MCHVFCYFFLLLLQRVGYLAATQCFHEGVDVVMLTTNMIRKDISTHNQYDASLALNGLACFMTLDLARWVLIKAASSLIPRCPHPLAENILVVA